MSEPELTTIRDGTPVVAAILLFNVPKFKEFAFALKRGDAKTFYQHLAGNVSSPSDLAGAIDQLSTVCDNIRVPIPARHAIGAYRVVISLLKKGSQQGSACIRYLQNRMGEALVGHNYAVKRFLEDFNIVTVLESFVGDERVG